MAANTNRPSPSLPQEEGWGEEALRLDVEPWARMTGGVIKDALDEADIKPGAQLQHDLPFDERLRRLEKLRENHLITDEEYQQTKAKILQSA